MWKNAVLAVLVLSPTGGQIARASVDRHLNEPNATSPSPIAVSPLIKEDFAAQPKSQVKVTTTPSSRIRKIEITGEAAQAVYLDLKDAIVETQAIGPSIVRTKKTGEHITCQVFSGKDESYSCKLYVDRDQANPTPEPSFLPSTLPTVIWQGSVATRTGEVSFSGESAKAIHEFLQENKEDKGIRCESREDAGHINYRCKFKVDHSGTIKRASS